MENRLKDDSNEPPPNEDKHNLLWKYRDVPCRLRTLHVENALRSKPKVFEEFARTCFEATTFQDVLVRLQEATARLYRLDLFDQIDIALDTDKSDTSPRLKTGHEGPWIDVRVSVREKSRVLLKTGTEIGNHEGSLRASMQVRNVFGEAESMKTDFSFGTRTNSCFEAIFTKPILRTPESSLQFLGLQQHGLHPYASHESLARSLVAKYNVPSRFGQHTFSYDVSWRQLLHFSDTSSFLARQDAGHSLKSSLLHTFHKDTRDHPSLPSRGHLCQLETEFAGLGGGVKHLKNQLVVQTNLPLSSYGHSISGTFRLGHILPLGSTIPIIHDRLFAGGPTSVRGFEWNSLGPRDKHDALGGTVGYQAGVSLFAPLPKLSRYDWLRAHVFLNAGTLAYDPRELGWPSASTGVGLALKHPICRIELNWHVPLVQRADERFKAGFGFGIGLHFL